MASKLKVNHQPCPICKQYVKFSSRYPNYICQRCVRLATDENGKAVSFFKKTGKLYNSNLYYIKGIKCKAEEAYFGGIVKT